MITSHTICSSYGESIAVSRVCGVAAVAVVYFHHHYSHLTCSLLVFFYQLVNQSDDMTRDAVIC